MYIIVQDQYSFYGLWNKGMMGVGEDGRLVNIRRDDSVVNAVNVCNLFNECSSRDAMDIDLYEVDDESKLVYFQETAERRMVKVGDEEKPELFNKKVTLIFNKDSVAYKDIIVDYLVEKDIKKTNIEVLERGTFKVLDDEAVDAVSKWTGMTLNPKDNTLLCLDTAEEEDTAVEITCTKDDMDTIPF